MLRKWFGNKDKISKRYARQVCRYRLRCKRMNDVDDRMFYKLATKLKKHMARVLPEDSFYLQIYPESMCNIRVAAISDPDDIPGDRITIEDMVINGDDKSVDYDEHEGTIFVPIKHSNKFVVVDFGYDVRR